MALLRGVYSPLQSANSCENRIANRRLNNSPSPLRKIRRSTLGLTVSGAQNLESSTRACQVYSLADFSGITANGFKWGSSGVTMRMAIPTCLSYFLTAMLRGGFASPRKDTPPNAGISVKEAPLTSATQKRNLHSTSADQQKGQKWLVTRARG